MARDFPTRIDVLYFDLPNSQRVSQSDFSIEQLTTFRTLVRFLIRNTLSHVPGVLTRDLSSRFDVEELAFLQDSSDFAPNLTKIAQSTRSQVILYGKWLVGRSEDSTQATPLFLELSAFFVGTHQVVLNRTYQIPWLSPEASATGEMELPPEGAYASIRPAILELLSALGASDEFVSEIPNNVLTTSYAALDLLSQADSLPYDDTAGKIERYEAALQHDAQIELAHAQLGNLYRISRAIKRSVLHYKKAIESCQGNPKHRAEYATEAGNACAVLGESEFATQWWQRGIHYDPTLINPYLNLAHLCEENEAFDDAEQYLVAAQKHHPDDYRCYFSLARIYSKTASWDKAVEQYQRQISMGGDDPWCHSDVATCYLQMGDTEKAQYHLSKTAEMDPEGEAGEYARLILVGLGV